METNYKGGRSGRNENKRDREMSEERDAKREQACRNNKQEEGYARDGKRERKE